MRSTWTMPIGSSFFLLVILLFESSAQAQVTWYVAVGGTGNGSIGLPFGSIQSAITAASTNDTIVVGPGTYFENVVFGGKSVELIAPQGPGMTAIDGQMAGTVVTFTGGETTAAVLDGFEIRNGFGGGACCGGVRQPGGIQIVAAAPRIRRCRIINNVGQTNTWPDSMLSGAGGVEAYLSGNAADFEDCSFVSNSGGNFNSAPGAIRVFGTTARFVRCTFDSNIGGGWEVFNFNGGSAGAMDISAGTILFEECRFIGNQGGYGGPGVGTIRGCGGPVMFVRCVFIQNVGGNGVPFPYPAFYGNPDAAGAFELKQACPAVFQDCTFAGNSGVNVGTIHFDGGTGTLDLLRTIVWNTSAPTEISGVGGALAITDCVVRGGAIGTNVLTADPQFVSYPVDVHLVPTSPCIDAATTLPAQPILDWDGDRRPFYGAADIGIDEYVSPAFDGTANLPSSGPSVNLQVNGDAATGTHTVDVGIGSPIALTLQPLDGTSVSDYVLWLKFGSPLLAEEFPTPFGALVVTPFEAVGAWPFATAASSIALPSAAIVTPPAPIQLSLPGGLSFSATFTLQALLVNAASTPLSIATSNAIVLTID